jgi:hypothetical protein
VAAADAKLGEYMALAQALARSPALLEDNLDDFDWCLPNRAVTRAKDESGQIYARHLLEGAKTLTNLDAIFINSWRVLFIDTTWPRI